MMNENDVSVWSVFVPYQFLVLPSGHMYGQVHISHKRIYITGLGNVPETSNSIIGEWVSDDFGQRKILTKTLTGKRSIWVTLYRQISGQIGCDCLSGIKLVHVNCILFNPHNILESYFLQSPSNIADDDNIIKPLITFSGILCNDALHQTSFFGSVKSRFSKMNICDTFLKVWTALYAVLTVFIDNRYTKKGVLKSIIEIPSYTQHLIRQKRILSSTKRSKNRFLETQNLISQTVLDVILGILVMMLLMQNGVIDSISTQFFVWTEKVASELDILLNWLMGAPAGLKLNKPLTEFLGHFFMYHIYLWKGYLHLLKPVFSTVLWYTSCVGVLGLSAQICLLQDIFSITTLHIYCYYVYAARLYRLQVYVLSALWRLFRGKKWNVLRHRVDSASFDVDQLFVGTLLFTIFLFLLPTTALYYTVFTLLRMVVLVFHGALSTIVYIVDHLPVYSVLLWTISSSKVSGEISLEVVPSDEPTSCQVFALQVHKIPLGELLKMTESNHVTTLSQPSLSWKHFLLNLLKGHLVYPWIDLQKKSSQ